MSLADKIWKPVTIHDMAADFLYSERHRFPPEFLPEVLALTETPDFTDHQQNHRRLRLLYIIRRHIFGEIPPDTQWYDVRNLTDVELDDLYVIARIGWDWKADKDSRHPEDRNELRSVALRCSRPLRDHPSTWRRPILWGHEKSGPFTIIEGNHRLIAYASTHTMDLDIPVLVGLSATSSPLHSLDPAQVLLNDLWQHNPGA